MEKYQSMLPLGRASGAETGIIFLLGHYKTSGADMVDTSATCDHVVRFTVTMPERGSCSLNKLLRKILKHTF